VVVLFSIILVAVLVLVLGGVFAEPIVALIRRRVPNFSYEGGVFLLWGLLIATAFAFGLVVMYVLVKP
jgi:hypothetical protein